MGRIESSGLSRDEWNEKRMNGDEFRWKIASFAVFEKKTFSRLCQTRRESQKNYKNCGHHGAADLSLSVSLSLSRHSLTFTYSISHVLYFTLSHWLDGLLLNFFFSLTYFLFLFYSLVLSHSRHTSLISCISTALKQPFSLSHLNHSFIVQSDAS